MNRTMTGTEIFEAWNSLDHTHQEFMVSANVQYRDKEWNISGMNAHGELDLVDLSNRETASINAEEIQLSVEFVLVPLKDETVVQ